MTLRHGKVSGLLGNAYINLLRFDSMNGTYHVVLA